MKRYFIRHDMIPWFVNDENIMMEQVSNTIKNEVINRVVADGYLECTISENANEHGQSVSTNLNVITSNEISTIQQCINALSEYDDVILEDVRKKLIKIIQGE